MWVWDRVTDEAGPDHEAEEGRAEEGWVQHGRAEEGRAFLVCECSLPGPDTSVDRTLVLTGPADDPGAMGHRFTGNSSSEQRCVYYSMGRRFTGPDADSRRDGFLTGA